MKNHWNATLRRKDLPIANSRPGSSVVLREYLLLEQIKRRRAAASQARSIHWSPYDRVGVVNPDP